MCIEQMITEVQESVEILLRSNNPVSCHKKYVSQFELYDKANYVGMLVSFLDKVCVITDISFENVLSIETTGVVCTFDIFLVDPNSKLTFIAVQQRLRSYARFNSITEI